MSIKKPEYIPAPVWRYWLEHRDAPGFNGAAMKTAGPRLLGLQVGPVPAECDKKGVPLIAKTWKRMTKTPRSEQDWCLIFDAFWTFPETADPEARKVLRECRALAQQIAETAAILEDLLGDYTDRAERHRIATPHAARLTEVLLESAADLSGTRRDFDARCAPYLTTGSAPGVNTDALPGPAALVAAIARAFDDFTPECFGPGADHANPTEVATLAGWLRRFSKTLYLLNKSLRPSVLELGPTDTARVLTAALHMTFSKQIVDQEWLRDPYATKEKVKD